MQGVIHLRVIYFADRNAMDIEGFGQGSFIPENDILASGSNEGRQRGQVSTFNIPFFKFLSAFLVIENIFLFIFASSSNLLLAWDIAA